MLWFVLLLGLPLTSFPVLSRLTGSIVAPFSFLPLMILLLFWLVPYVLERGVFPGEVVPYLYFILVAAAVTGLGFFLNGFYIRERNFFDQSLRAFLSVAIGLSFYLVFAAFPRDSLTLRKTLSYINITGFVLLLWSLIEIIVLRSKPRVEEMPAIIRIIRNALAVQSPSMIYTNRLTGFAYEPSWFVRQFNLMLLPIWMAAAFQRLSIYKFRLWIFTIEDFLLAAGLFVFGSSSPRIGLVALLASIAYLAMILFLSIHKRLMNWFLKKRKKPVKHLFGVKIILAILMLAMMAGLAASALFGYIELASRWDYRYALLLDNLLKGMGEFSLSTTDIIYRARDLAFFERMIYWLSGWNVFADYPFGVGLGNSGFYIFDRLHGAGWESYEIRDVIYQANQIPNSKNLWTRLLSETGFIGLAIFLVWLYVLWRSAGLTRRSKTSELKIMGLAGQLFLLAFLLEGFSIDSFAMPYEWIMAGLISASGWLYRKEFAVEKQLQIGAAPEKFTS
jgi:hypothetical protein